MPPDTNQIHMFQKQNQPKWMWEFPNILFILFSYTLQYYELGYCRNNYGKQFETPRNISHMHMKMTLLTFTLTSHWNFNFGILFSNFVRKKVNNGQLPRKFSLYGGSYPR